MASTVDASRVAEHYDDEAALNEKITLLASMVGASSYTVFFTGAGVSTSSGVGDYRGPSGAWTKRRIRELQDKGRLGTITAEEQEDLDGLLREAERERAKSAKKVDMTDAEPSVTHMAMATLMRLGLAHHVITTNLDGIYRKAGLQGHTQLTCLHGDIYIERCTGCGYDFERNFEVRQPRTHVHDHCVGTCSRCGSHPPASYTGWVTKKDVKTGSKTKFAMNGLISTTDVNLGTKDTHINFGELLDSMDWAEADKQCKKADLCIVAGTSMSLRHVHTLAPAVRLTFFQAHHPFPVPVKTDCYN
ncbi:transcriptional regulator, Sir2 family protein [Pelomyxa schiedti]|nr:transcriptional regulator, Sir2 family protein [Pelomyxa schiedti]